MAPCGVSLMARSVAAGTGGAGAVTRGREVRGAVAYNRPVTVTVLLFASIAEAAGARRIEIASAPGETVADVRERLLTERPALRRFIPTLMYALNEEYVRDDAVVPDGATLALIPPVSGG